jgi:hypothetical protein
MTGAGAGHEMTGAGAGHEITGAGAGQHTGCAITGIGQQSSSSSSANTRVCNPASVIIRDNAIPIKTGYFILLVIIYLHRSDRFTGGDEHASPSRDYDLASDILAGRALRREAGCRFARASAASVFDRRWRVAVRLCRPYSGVSTPVQRYAARLLGITLSSPPAVRRRHMLSTACGGG